MAGISTTLNIGDPSQDIKGEPFYSHFFTGLIKKVSEQTETLAVSYENHLITLYINPQFWLDTLNRTTLKIGAIKHEILHIVFKHIFRYQDFQHMMLFNLAADLVVNQYIKQAHLVEGAILLEDFPELKLQPHQHVNYYYEALENLQKQFSGENSTPDDPKNKSWQTLKSLLVQENPLHKKHFFWKEITKLSNAEKDIAESMVNQALEATLSRIKPEQYGNLPAQLRQYLDAFQYGSRNTLNWKRVLRLFTNSSCRTSIKNTIRRPSKRYGSTPGIKVKKKQKILIAMDTSGSIQKPELQEFFSEIYHIWKQGVDVFVVECDIHIHQHYPYRGKPPEFVQGGGGTSFEAPIEYARRVFRPDSLIYFTDGYGPKPESQAACPVLWLISRGGVDLEQIKHFPGRKIKMI
ncbi:MAG: hypothetical protein HC880_09530 [Bacteroidia bacterium]|nr:hypothetical protein [Bacteroidia bacterium]